ncbi:MAG: Hsp20/alpha crystallin family protein [Anaerolineaceae bacterium]|nr:Hsp20/alpha crystallin family protein [Anaerolineaceae bacterium]MDD4042751.1 Hsp20/alpha crystallin family protein [Anaerolineaceae bacterium]MDD4577842.1 Hsp20/alpha crystallin family protein [Anaerolineaceae bacterium]
MAYMIRRSPYWRNQFLERAMNRYLDMESEQLPSGFPLDVLETDTEYTVKADVAGFDPEKIEITYDDNTLSIKGLVEDDTEKSEEGKYHVRERRFGSFYRSISMPGVIDADQITADSDNGILVVHLPKKPETQPKKINVVSKKIVDSE